jgi:hypothetical protein
MATLELILHRAVVEDVTRAVEDLAREDTPWRRRSFVRAAFASIEAIVFILKQDALRLATAQPGHYSVAQLALLREESYAFSKGKPHASPRYIPLPDNFRFAVDMVMHGIMPGITLHVGVQAWEALKKGVEVRNRIVHPKSLSDLDVSDEDRENVYRGFLWVHEATIKSLFNAYSARADTKGAPLPPEIADVGERWQLMSQSEQAG